MEQKKDIFDKIMELPLINIFNPYNPFKLLQKPTIEQPSDKEYLLVIELVKNW